MTPLPPPTTFAEGERKLYGRAAGIAGVAMGLAVLVGASIVVFGDWGAGLLKLQLYILAGCLAVGSLNTTIVIIGLMVGGPVGRFKVEATKDGASVEADSAQ
jgi:hypothetical protein